MEYINVSKSVMRVVKHLLNYSSTDTAREYLFSTIHVDLEKGVISSADGFKLSFVKMTDELKEVFKENGTFKVQTGMINHTPVITLEKYEGYYPDLYSVISGGETFVKFGINPHFLKEALRYANDNEAVQFIIHKYENIKPEEGITIPIEMRFGVEDCFVDSIIMPMHMSSDKRWGIKDGG